MSQKQTAKNNEFLRLCKVCLNAKIYKQCVYLMNTQNEQTARDYINQFYKCSIEELYNIFNK